MDGPQCVMQLCLEAVGRAKHSHNNSEIYSQSLGYQGYPYWGGGFSLGFRHNVVAFGNTGHLFLGSISVCRHSVRMSYPAFASTMSTLLCNQVAFVFKSFKIVKITIIKITLYNTQYTYYDHLVQYTVHYFTAGWVVTNCDVIGCYNCHLCFVSKVQGVPAVMILSPMFLSKVQGVPAVITVAYVFIKRTGCPIKQHILVFWLSPQLVSVL